jgi:carbon-monoxide dehydrogenase iron sulfur subunit
MSENATTTQPEAVETRLPDEHREEAQPPEKKLLLSRRRMLGFLGVQLAAGALAVTNVMAAPKNFKPECTNRGITPAQLPNARAWLVTDPTACVGCRTCEIVCSLSHDDTCQPTIARIHTLYDPLHSLNKLCAMTEACKQCNMADCYLACQYDALVLDPKTGARIIDPKKCQGCGECLAACPWNMVVFNEAKNIYSKCDLCGGDPLCVKYCPADAIKFVELG